MKEVKGDIYEVYEVTYKGKCVYIGSGEGAVGNKPARHEHVKSGKSSNAKLNELFFKDAENVKVIVLRDNLSKEDSLELERDFIMASEPKFNIQHNQKNHKVKKFRKYTI